MARRPSPQLTGTLAIAAIDIAHHAAKAYSARQQHRDRELDNVAARLLARTNVSAGRFRDRSRAAALDALDHAPAVVRDRIPWSSRRSWQQEHRVLLVVSFISGLVIAALAITASASRRIAGAPPIADRVREATAAAREYAAIAPSNSVEFAGAQSRVAEAVDTTRVAATAAIDAVGSDAGAAVAVGKAAAAQAVHEHVTEPAVHQVKKYGALAIIGLTAYIIVIAVVVQLAVLALT